MKQPLAHALQSLLHTATRGRVKYGWYDSDFSSTERPVFSGGCPRSGTTLLYAILNAHSHISLGLETGLLTGNKNLQKISIRSDLPEATLRDLYHSSRSYPEFTQRVLTAIMHRDHKQRWGDKSPVNARVMDGIFKHFPQAQFLHALRDGRDAVCSIRRHPPSFGNRHQGLNPWQECVDLWCTWVGDALKWRGDPRYYEIRYEDLTCAPQATLGKCLEWLGEPWEDNLFEKSVRTKVDSHPGVSTPVNDVSVGRWKQDLPPEARRLFQGRAADLLVELGYANDDSWMKD